MIPKIIHYCWFGGNPLPERFTRCIDSWRRVMPDYEIRRWDESNYAIDETCDYVREAYEAGYWAFVSDYARLDICTRYGGIYLDVDVEAVTPFDDLLDREVIDGRYGSLGTIQEVLETPANDVWVIDGSTYGEVLIPVIDQVIAEIPEEGPIAVTIMDGIIDAPAAAGGDSTCS